MSSKSLANQTPSQSYKDLIHLGNNGNGLTNNLSVLYDGDGKPLPISVSSNQVSINMNGGKLESPIINGYFEKINKLGYVKSSITLNLNNFDGFIKVPEVINENEIALDEDPYDAYNQNRWIIVDGKLRLIIRFEYNPAYLNNINTNNEFLYFQQNLIVNNRNTTYNVSVQFENNEYFNVSSKNTNYDLWGSNEHHLYKVYGYIDGNAISNIWVEYAGLMYSPL